MKKGMMFLTLIVFSIIFIGFGSAACSLSGAGTEANPYRISSIQDLDEIRNCPNNAYFKLTKNINCDYYNYGSEDNPTEEFDTLFSCGRETFDSYEDYEKSEVFTGTFDGQGYKICGLKIDGGQDYYRSLFGCVDKEAIIKNLNLIGIEIGDIYERSGCSECGGLAGYNKGLIENVHIYNYMFKTEKKGVIGGTSGHAVGGLVGINEGVIYRCSVNGGFIFGGGNENEEYLGGVGGLVGDNRNPVWYPQKDEEEYYSNNDGEPYRTLQGVSLLTPYLENKDFYTETELKNLITDASGGRSGGYIIESYAATRVEGNHNVGGLVGTNKYFIGNSFVNGLLNPFTPKTPGIISYQGNAGGLVGYNGGIANQENLGVIKNSYTANFFIIGEYVGGLVGKMNGGEIINSFSGNLNQQKTNLVGSWATCEKGQIINSAGGFSGTQCVGIGDMFNVGDNIPQGFYYTEQRDIYAITKIVSEVVYEVAYFRYTPTGEYLGDEEKETDVPQILIPYTIDFVINRNIYSTYDQPNCDSAQDVKCDASYMYSWNKGVGNNNANYVWNEGPVIPEPVLSWINFPITDISGKCSGECKSIFGCGSGFTESYGKCDSIFSPKCCIKTEKCGLASEMEHAEKPSIFLCSLGNPSSVTGTGIITNPWKWKCYGAGGNFVDCKSYLFQNTPGTTPITAPECGNADGKTYSTKEEVETAGPCVSGNNIQSDGVNLSSDGTKWKWTCIGSEGITEDCEAIKSSGDDDDDDRITECTTSNQCWIKNANCTSLCICESGYTPDGTGRCIISTSEPCINGQTDCVGTNYRVCENQVWVDKGCVVGKCGCSNVIPIGTGTCGDKIVQKPNSAGVEEICDGSCTAPKGAICECSSDCKLEIITYTDGSDCVFKSILEGKCSEGADSITKVYEYDSGKEECKNKKLPVPEKVMCPARLPFFTIVNLVITLICIGLVYIALMMLRNRKQGKKRK